MERHPLLVKRKHDWGRGFILLLRIIDCIPVYSYHRMLYCKEQVMASLLLSHHRLSSSRTVRLRAPRDIRCRLWAMLIRSHLWFVQWRRICDLVKEQDPLLRMDVWNAPTPVRRRLTLSKGGSEQAHSNKLSTGHGNESMEL